MNPRDTRNKLFNDNATDTENSPYYGWNGILSIPTVAERTVFYDSNIAFTNGKAGISNEITKTVPNLYDTLVGLNTRINDIISSSTSIDGIETFVDETTSNVIMSAVHDTNLYSLTINANDISFKFKNGTTYSMQDIFEMLEELRARTHMIKTNVERANIISSYISNEIHIVEPPGNTGDLWIKNYISQLE